MTIRKAIFWTHFVIGLLAGLFIFVMSVTGLALTYQPQIERWARNNAIEAPAGGSPVSIEAAAAAARSLGAEDGARLTIPRDRTQVMDVEVGPREVMHLDPYTGTALPQDTGRIAVRLFGRVLALHRWLSPSGGPSRLGGEINAAANLVFTFVLVTGAVLWWPRSWRWPILRTRMLLRRNLPTIQARDYNWHHVFGFWCLAPLCAIAVTGVLLSYGSLGSAVYAFVERARPDVSLSAPEDDRTGPAPQSRNLPLDTLLARAAERAERWSNAVITLPSEHSNSVRIALTRGNGLRAASVDTFIVARDGSSIERLPGASTSARSFVRYLHTGEIYGIPGQTFAGLASLGSAMLVYTGLSLGLRRLMRMLRAATPRP